MWETELATLTAWLDDMNTAPHLILDNTSGLRQLYTGTLITNQSEVYRDQNSLGWGHFFEGTWSIKWRDEQASYLTSISSRCSARQWTIATISYLWRLGYRFWLSRNKIEHDLDLHCLLEQLDWQIAIEIDTGFDAIHTNRSILTATALDRVQQSTNPDYKRCWLRLIKSMRTIPARGPIARILDRTQALMSRFYPANT